MSLHTASVEWTRDGAVYADNRYPRRHRWRFDGGVEVPASSSPHVVPTPMSSEDAVDPEEAFVASLASCHLLWFLDLARRAGHVVERYVDEAEGTMGRDAGGRLAMTVVVLRPRVDFAGPNPPDAAAVDALHHAAHEACFIANSVKTDVRCEPRHA